ncbi:MAG: TIM-barrel domain-containing protein [Oscillospiraceae bacterium]
MRETARGGAEPLHERPAVLDTRRGRFFTVKDDYTKRGCGGGGNPNPPLVLGGEYNDGCHDPRYRELYTRWLQYAVFLPVFRSHGTDTPREIWNFGEKGTMFYDALEAAYPSGGTG